VWLLWMMVDEIEYSMNTFYTYIRHAYRAEQGQLFPGFVRQGTDNSFSMLEENC